MPYNNSDYHSGIKSNFPDAEYRDILKTSKELFSCVVFSADEEKIIDTHYHDYIELIYVTVGSLDVTINKENYSLIAGDMIVIIPSDVHKIVAHKGARYIVLQTETNFIFASILSNTDLHYSMPYTLSKIENARYFSAKQLDTTQIPRLIYFCTEEYAKKDNFYKLAFRSAMSAIALLVFRFWDENKIEFETQSDNTGLPRLSNVLKEIDTNYSKDLTAEEMAEIAGMSYSYFSRFFKNTMGHTFSEYLNSVRIRAAERLLLETDIPIADIAAAVGFSNTSYFIVQFKRQLHITPKKYRSNYSEK